MPQCAGFVVFGKSRRVRFVVSLACQELSEHDAASKPVRGSAQQLAAQLASSKARKRRSSATIGRDDGRRALARHFQVVVFPTEISKSHPVQKGEEVVPNPCKVCISSDRLEIEQTVRSGSSLRQTAQLYGLSASSIARHAQHGPPEPTAPVSRTHTTDAEEVIAAVRVLRGLDWTAQDQAEAGQLLSLAGAVDADRTNVAALREFRLTLAGFRQGSFRPDPTEQMELAELIASISGPPPDAWQKAFDAAVAAGVPPDAAGNVASAATDRNFDPHPAQTPEEWHARKRSGEAAIADYQRTGHYERKAQHNDRFT